jgi:serine/threonine protein phosphatase 1
VIGDVHGCEASLQELVAQLPPQDRLILCGDVINRGPRILEAMEAAWTLVESGRAVWLRGNHEQALLDDLRGQGWLAYRALAGCDTYRQLGDRRCRAWQSPHCPHLDDARALPTSCGAEGRRAYGHRPEA